VVRAQYGVEDRAGPQAAPIADLRNVRLIGPEWARAETCDVP